MTLDDAIKFLTENYKIAQKREFIVKPLSWALYQTWEEVDKKGEEKGADKKGGDKKNDSL